MTSTCTEMVATAYGTDLAHSRTPRPQRLPRSPSVLLVTELFPPAVGGSAVLFEGIYSRLDHRDVVVVTDDTRSAAQHRSSGSAWIERYPLSCNNWGLLNPNAFAHHWRVGSHMRRLADSRKTIVHCARTLPEGLGAWLCRLRGGPPFACWAHGEDLTLQTTASREMRWLTGRICRSALALFANSRNTASMLTGLGVPESKIHVIYPGVDPQRFCPEHDGTAIRQELAPNNEPLILSVGRLERRKGFDLLIRAVRALRHAGIALRYAIVGDGPDRDYLQQLIHDQGMDDCVIMVGKVEAEALPLFYAACDLFVHPNRIEQQDVEGFGIVFLEAAASGKPVIGGASGGVGEAVANGQTGLLVSGTDVDELAAAIRGFLESPQLCYEMGQSGRERVLERFTWEHAAKAMSAVQTELEQSR